MRAPPSIPNRLSEAPPNTVTLRIGLLSFLFFFLSFLFFKDFIYLFGRERKREKELGGEGDADCPLSREPDWRLDPPVLGL